MEASIGSGLIASGVGTPLGIVMLLHGADNAVAGISQITTGKKTVSITYDKAKKIAKVGGASDQTAEYIATFADASISIAGAGLASSVSRSLTRSAPKIGLEIVEESGNKCYQTRRFIDMKAKNESKEIVIKFSEEEALVLLAWLHTFNEVEHPTLFQDQAEERILFDLETELETVVSATFSFNYQELLLKARAKIRDLE